MSSGLTATGLILLLLAMIGAGVGLYYAYICLQARPLRPKKHKDAEHGPLIPPDPDFNGNHEEEVPLDPSAPLHEEPNGDIRKLHPDLPDEKDTPSGPPPADESADTPRKKENVLINVEDEVSPASVAHEVETAPVVSHAPPLGFVVPAAVVVASQDAPADHHPAPVNPQPHPEKLVSSPSTSSAPVPVYIPSPPQKKPIAISDEEDGLLLHDPPHQHHDDSLDPDNCATLPVSHPSRKPQTLNEEPQIITHSPATAPPPPQLEGPPPTQPTTEPEEQPAVVMVVPHTTPTCPEKEHLKPVTRAPDSQPSEECEKPVPASSIKEQLTSSPTNKDRDQDTTTPPGADEVAVPVVGAIPVEESQESDDEDSAIKERAVDSDDSLCAGDSGERSEQTPKSPEDDKREPLVVEVDKTEPAPEDTKPEPPVECKETEPALQDNNEEEPEDKEPEPSPEDNNKTEPIPPHSPHFSSPVIVDIKPHPDAERIPPPSPTGEVMPDIPVVALQVPSDTTPASRAENECTQQLEPNVPSHLQTVDDEDLSDASLSDLSDTNNEDKDTPPQSPAVPPQTEVDAGKEPLVVPPEIPIDASNIPLEGYNVMLDDGLSDDSDGPLPVIKEEGSTDNNSESNTDTESSEPEVTEYSFSSGPSAPSTTGVLANEVSCTMEPKVTKFVQITDLDDSHSEGTPISGDEDSDDSASLSDEEQNDMDLMMPAENKVINEEKPTNTAEKRKDFVDNLDSSPKVSAAEEGKPVVSTNGPETHEPRYGASDSEDSNAENEGEEAEVKEGTRKPNTTQTETQTPPPKPQLLKAPPQGNGSSLEEIPSTTDEDCDDGLSLSPSESCDLSDGDVTASTPKKSLIPRLVKQSEA